MTVNLKLCFDGHIYYYILCIINKYWNYLGLITHSDKSVESYFHRIVSQLELKIFANIFRRHAFYKGQGAALTNPLSR
jgi:hypothetical protein